MEKDVTSRFKILSEFKFEGRKKNNFGSRVAFKEPPLTEEGLAARRQENIKYFTELAAYVGKTYEQYMDELCREIQEEDEQEEREEKEREAAGIKKRKRQPKPIVPFKLVYFWETASLSLHINRYKINKDGNVAW